VSAVISFALGTMSKESDLISVSIVSINGEHIFSESFPSAAPVKDSLLPRVAEAMAMPPSAIRLIYGESMLKPEESLASASVVDAATVTAVVDHFLCLVSQAQTILDKIAEGDGLVGEMYGRTAQSFESAVAALASPAGGAEPLCEELRAFLTAMLHARKVVHWRTTLDMNMVHDEHPRMQDGLFYLYCPYEEDEYVLPMFVDLTGKLGEGRGSVWYAALQEAEVDMWGLELFPPIQDRYTLPFWQRVLSSMHDQGIYHDSNNGRPWDYHEGEGLIRFVVPPYCMATSVTKYFEAWAHSECPIPVGKRFVNR